MYYYHENYKGGTNNLFIIQDEKGNRATSLKDYRTAEKNLKTQLKRQHKQKERKLRWLNTEKNSSNV